MFQLFICPLVISATLAQEAPVTTLEVSAVTPITVDSDPGNTFELLGDLRAEYLSGQPIVVTLTVKNNGSEPATFPNLSARPWLVRFKIEPIDSSGRSGQTQTRFTTPPEVDGMGLWTIPPRGMRTVTIEVPSGASLGRGTYNIAIEVDGQAGLFEIANTQVSIATPSPIANHLPNEIVGIERTGLHATWLHRATTGFDLYIHSVSGDQLDGDSFNTHIAHLSSPITPTLSRSLPAQALNRFVYWSQGERGIGFVESSGEMQNRVDSVELPYPQIELLARGITTPSSELLVPVWIPSPTGISGEVRVVEINNGRMEAVTSVVRMRSKPTWAESGIDNSGALRLLLGHGEGVDLYTLAGATGLPARGIRLIQGGGSLTRGAFGISTYEQHQGLSVITTKLETSVSEDTEEEQATERLVTNWWTLGGDLIDSPTPFTISGQGNQIDRLLGGPSGLWAINYNSVSGQPMFANQQGESHPIGDSQHLIWDSNGILWLRNSEGNSPITAQPVN